MIAFHLVRFPEIFYLYIKEDLGDQSYVSYCKNIFEESIWGDDVMLAAVGHMWNLSISVVMPFSEVLHLFHEEYNSPDIVIVVNGGPPESSNPSTHFCATKSRLMNPKIPVCKQGYKNPKVYDQYEVAKKISEERKEERLRRTIFSRLRNINFQIDKMDDEMKNLEQSLKQAKKTQGEMEKELLELGFNVKSLRTIRKTLKWNIMFQK